MPSDWSEHPLIQRLLDADEPPDLTDRELALLDACLKQPLQPSRIQREKRRTGRSEYREQRNRLKLARYYNRNLRAAEQGETPAETLDARPGSGRAPIARAAGGPSA